MTRSVVVGWTLALAACVGLVECTASPEEPLAPPARHAAFSEELRTTMRDLERMRHDLPPDIDPDAVQRRRLEHFVATVRSMAASAERIPDILVELPFDSAQRGDFVALARALSDGANALADDATGLSVAQLGARVEQLERTCTACHGRFRVPR